MKTSLPTKEELEELYYKKDLSIKKIAKHLQRGHTFIWQLFKEYKIPVKSRTTYENTEEQIDTLLNQFKNEDAKKWVSKWINEKKKSAGLDYIRQKLYTYLKILDPLEKPIEKIIKTNDQEAINKVLDKNNLRKHRILMVEFFKWVNEGERPKCIKKIITKRTKEELRPDIDLLTFEERKAIIDNAPTQRDRLIFLIMNELPTRPKDIVNLKVKDAVADEFGYQLKLHSKTQSGFRTIRLINAVPDMRLYLSTHKERNNPESPLFYSYANRDKNDKLLAIQFWGINYALKEACRRAKIKRKVTLYYFRKTTTAELLQDPRYTPKEVQVMGGWKNIETPMNIYGKVTSEMANTKRLIEEGKTNPKIKKILLTKAKTDKNLHHSLVKYGLIKDGEIIEVDKFAPVICPRCQEPNPTNVDSCVKCWLPLSQKGIEKQVIAEKGLGIALKEYGEINEETVRKVINKMRESGEIKV